MKAITYTDMPPVAKSIGAKNKREVKSHSAKINRYTTDDHLVSNQSNKYGLAVSAILILYFISMKYLGMHRQMVLRYCNVIFLFLGVLLAINSYRYKCRHKAINFFTGFKIGMQVSFMAIAPFSLFMWVYLKTDSGFMNFIKTDLGLGYFLNPTIVSISLFVEGLSYGIIAALIILSVMNFKKAEKKHQSIQFIR